MSDHVRCCFALIVRRTRTSALLLVTLIQLSNDRINNTGGRRKFLVLQPVSSVEVERALKRRVGGGHVAGLAVTRPCALPLQPVHTVSPSQPSIAGIFSARAECRGARTTDFSRVGKPRTLQLGAKLPTTVHAHPCYVVCATLRRVSGPMDTVVAMSRIPSAGSYRWIRDTAAEMCRDECARRVRRNPPIPGRGKICEG